jgi:hypothetical protein
MTTPEISPPPSEYLDDGFASILKKAEANIKAPAKARRVVDFGYGDYPDVMNENDIELEWADEQESQKK